MLIKWLFYINKYYIQILTFKYINIILYIMLHIYIILFLLQKLILTSITFGDVASFNNKIVGVSCFSYF